MRPILCLLAICVPPALGMSTTLGLGGLFTSGNSSVKQLDAGLEVTGMHQGKLETGFLLRASYGSQDDAAYLEKYLSEGTLRYSFTDNNYAVSRAYWTRDEFSGVSHEYGATLGYGRRLLSGGALTASLEAGAGYLFRENTMEETLETATWYSGTVWKWQATDSWSLTETARITGDLNDSDNYSITSSTEASSAITGSLSFVTGFDVAYHNVPPVEGNEKTDTSLKLQFRLSI